MSSTMLATPTLELHLAGDDPLLVERAIHRPSGRIVCEQVRQTILARFPKRLSEPVFATVTETVRADGDKVSFSLVDESRELRVACEISSGEEGIRWRLRAETDEPLWMFEWRMSGFDLSRVIVPALGGQMLAEDMPADTQVTYKYPFWWNAQFGIGEFEDGGGVWLRTLDAEPKMKLLRVSRIHERKHLFGLGLGFEADAPLKTSPLEATWYVDGFEGSWKAPVDRHRRWLESAFGVTSYRSHPHYPDWMEDIDFILEIWGMSKERPTPLHTFEDMTARIRAFAAHHPPSQTLLYLPGFAGGGIDSNAPDYTPSEKLGGTAGLRSLVDEAHRLGYRVMLHTNVLAMAYTHPLFPEFEKYQVIDPFERPMGWGNDIDGDWLAEPFFAYMNPGYEAWGDHMERVIGKLIEDCDVDGIFLDQTLLAFNDSRGPNFLAGMRNHMQRLQRAFPHTLFAGEGIHEQILPALPMAQIHGIDSIAGVHGLEGAREWRHVHPVSSYLFGKYTRVTAHLLTKHPSSEVFERQEAAYAQLDVMPALVLYKRSHEIDPPALVDMLRRAGHTKRTQQEKIVEKWS